MLVISNIAKFSTLCQPDTPVSRLTETGAHKLKLSTQTLPTLLEDAMSVSCSSDVLILGGRKNGS